jgi:hypothetical protein
VSVKDLGFNNNNNNIDNIQAQRLERNLTREKKGESNVLRNNGGVLVFKTVELARSHCSVTNCCGVRVTRSATVLVPAYSL